MSINNNAFCTSELFTYKESTALPKQRALAGFSSLHRNHCNPSPLLLFLALFASDDKPRSPTPAYNSHTLLPSGTLLATSLAKISNQSIHVSLAEGER
jgi:hypothetical protein